MYILKNAFKSIVRAKGRNLLIALIVLVLSVSSCIGLSIKRANNTLKTQYAEDREITATLTSRNKGISQQGVAIETLKEYADNNLVKDFGYTASLYFSADDGIEPLDVSGSFGQNKDFRDKYGDIKNGEIITSSTSSSTTSTESVISEDTADYTTDNNQNNNTTSFPQMPENAGENTENGNTAPENGGGMRGGDTFITHNHITNNQFFFNMASMNDFTVTGYSSYSAMPQYVKDLEVLDLEDNSRKCVISKALAEENEFEVGDKFTLANPENEDETYKFTIAGICDTSQSADTTNISSNASFTDNYIHISGAAIEKIIASSEKKNTSLTTEDAQEEAEEKSTTLSPIYSGTYSFKNLTDYTSMSELVTENNYSLVSEDVENYEQSIEQLETLGGYATYFLIVIFIIGAIVLIIINLFSIRDRKYEIGVLTAIGMKKRKVATQFVIELFCITFTALIIGSGIGAAAAVPVTNGLLTTINSTAEATENGSDITNIPENQNPPENPQDFSGEAPPEMPQGDMENNRGDMGERFKGFMRRTNNYIASVSSATDLHVIGQMILVGLGLTLISALSAVLFVMRYEPLKILSNRE